MPILCGDLIIPTPLIKVFRHRKRGALIKRLYAIISLLTKQRIKHIMKMEVEMLPTSGIPPPISEGL